MARSLTAGECVIPLCQAGRLERRPGRLASIVDQDFDCAQFGGCALDVVRQRRVIREVGDDRDRAPAQLAD